VRFSSGDRVCLQNRRSLGAHAAYAGSACICEEYNHLLNGLLEGDENDPKTYQGGIESFSFNPHKWLLTNFDFCALWVSNRADLVDALSITPEYLRNIASDTGAVIDYRDWQIPLGRRFRALKFWFVIRTYGVEGLKRFVRETIQLAEYFETLVRSDERFEILHPRCLSLVTFRLKNSSSDANKRLLDLVNNNHLKKVHNIQENQTTAAAAGGEGFFLSHTVVHDIFLIRMSIGSQWTRREHIVRCWEIFQRAASIVLSE